MKTHILRNVNTLFLSLFKEEILRSKEICESILGKTVVELLGTKPVKFREWLLGTEGNVILAVYTLSNTF